MPRSNISLKIPVTAIVVTKNEEARIARCLEALSSFDEVLVVDSNSSDATCDVAQKMGARVEHFSWDGAYPKKRQWCLDQLELAHDWVFFVDADEIVTRDVVDEIAALFDAEQPKEAGFFIEAQYIWQGRLLRHGLKNKKLVLLDRRRVCFPVIDDLELPGMGEIEGHYQPVLKDRFVADVIGNLGSLMQHDACDDKQAWEERHWRYALWDAGMNARDAWPKDPVVWRQRLKLFFRAMSYRDVAAFLHCYVFKLGFLDGVAGYDFAKSRARYYRMIRHASLSSSTG